MGVHKSTAWELDATDYERYQHLLPRDEDVQFMLTGWSSPANKCFLNICEQEGPKLFTADKRLKDTLKRSRKRNKI